MLYLYFSFTLKFFWSIEIKAPDVHFQKSCLPNWVTIIPLSCVHICLSYKNDEIYGRSICIRNQTDRTLNLLIVCLFGVCGADNFV